MSRSAQGLPSRSFALQSATETLMLELCIASRVVARARRLPASPGGGSCAEFEGVLPAARDKLLQRGATISDEGIAMREEQVFEVELVEEARVGIEHGALGSGRVVHQAVGNEAGLASLSTADDAVGEGDGTLFGEVERCLVRADSTYLTSQHVARERGH